MGTETTGTLSSFGFKLRRAEWTEGGCGLPRVSDFEQCCEDLFPLEFQLLKELLETGENVRGPFISLLIFALKVTVVCWAKERETKSPPRALSPTFSG